MKKPHRNTQPMSKADMEIELKRQNELRNPPRRSNKTNIERVTEFMEWGSALNQAFVMDAIYKQAAKILADPDAVRAAMEKNGSVNMINPEAWIKCAQDWKAKNPEYFR